MDNLVERKISQGDVAKVRLPPRNFSTLLAHEHFQIQLSSRINFGAITVVAADQVK